jgi:DNA-binding NarL/FixJ family response regulator
MRRQIERPAPSDEGGIRAIWRLDRMARSAEPGDVAGNARPVDHPEPSTSPRSRYPIVPSAWRAELFSARSGGAIVTAVVDRSHGSPRDLVRVVVVDDHPAIRMGLKLAIASHPGLICVGAASDGEEMWPLLERARPDVVVLDYQLPRASGLELCRRIKRDVLAPAVLLYSAYADPALVVPALVAGADGIVHKSAPTRELFESLRAVADGGSRTPPLIPELLHAAYTVLDAEDRPVLELVVKRTPRWQIAATLGLGTAELDERLGRMLARLHVASAVER